MAEPLLTLSDKALTMNNFISQHLLALRAEGRATSTIMARGRCLRRLDADLPDGIWGATAAQLREWLAYEGWKPWSRYTYAGHICEGFEWLYIEGYIQSNPAARIKRGKKPTGKPRPLKDDQLALCLTAPEPLRTAFLLANYEGMRRAEIADSEREHFSEEWVLIPNAKGGMPQTVPTHPLVWEHVRDMPEGPLIVDRRGKLNPDQLGVSARRWQERHGLPTGLHPGRHRFATEIQRRFKDIRVTQEAMRHKSISSTQVYTEVSDDDRINAVRALPAVELGAA